MSRNPSTMTTRTATAFTGIFTRKRRNVARAARIGATVAKLLTAREARQHVG